MLHRDWGSQLPSEWQEQETVAQKQCFSLVSFLFLSISFLLWDLDLPVLKSYLRLSRGLKLLTSPWRLEFTVLREHWDSSCELFYWDLEYKKMFDVNTNGTWDLFSLLHPWQTSLINHKTFPIWTGALLNTLKPVLTHQNWHGHLINLPSQSLNYSGEGGSSCWER